MTDGVHCVKELCFTPKHSMKKMKRTVSRLMYRRSDKVCFEEQPKSMRAQRSNLHSYVGTVVLESLIYYDLARKFFYFPSIGLK